MSTVVDASALSALEERLRQEVRECEARLRAEFATALASYRNALTEEETDTVSLNVAFGTNGESETPVTVIDNDTQVQAAQPVSCCSMLTSCCLPSSEQKDGYSAMRIAEQSSVEEGSQEGLRRTQLALIRSHSEGKVEFETRPLPVDMWGVAIMTLTRDLSDLMKCEHTREHLARCLYAMGCVFMNLFLQISILVWVNLYVVGQSIWSIQSHYAQFHHDVFDEGGNFLIDKWKTWEGPREELCSAVLTKRVFLAAILFLWTGRMLGEFKSCLSLFNDISAVPNMASGSLISDYIVYKEGKYEIVAMTSFARTTLYLLVLLPKTFICVLLWRIGCSWLTATMSFGDLILNALALEFVIGIDELILDCFLPESAKDNVKETVFAYPSEGPPSAEEKIRANHKDYFKDFVFLALSFLVTFIYLEYFQGVLPLYDFDIETHCGKWYEYRFHPPCHILERGCFPYGASSKEPHQYAMGSSGIHAPHHHR